METTEKANGQVKTNGQLKAEGQEQRTPQAPGFANNNPVNKESVKDKQEPEKPRAGKAEDNHRLNMKKLDLTLKVP